MNEDPVLKQVHKDLFFFWGKAGQEGSLDSHPALLHMLNVARCLADSLGMISLHDALLASTSDELIFGGLLTMADWLGSSEDNFPFVSEMPPSIPDYLEERRAIAIRLVRSLGLDTTVTFDKRFSELFPFPATASEIWPTLLGGSAIM